MNKMPVNKSLKKKESKDDGSSSGVPQVATEDQRKPIIPFWLEWSDQDILNEKWDPSKKDKEKVRSTSAQVNLFDDPEGKVLLPPSLNSQVKSWKRPLDIITGKTAVIVDPEFDHIGDLLIKNEHIIQDKVMNAVISCISVVSSYFSQAQFNETSSSSLKLKSSLVKEQNNTKADKIRKENEIKDEHFCNPWDLIWPKENPKSVSLPVVNLSGKYAVKLFWMGTQRKIIVDDTIPCDQNNLPLLPFTSRGNELWLPILTKAILKIASLHYCNNVINDLQDFHVVYCLLGWLPELIPLNEKYKDSIWKMLMQSLPIWKLPQTPIIVEHAPPDEKISTDELQTKQFLSAKVSKEKGAKIKDDKKLKLDKDKTQKDKIIIANQPLTKVDETPVIVFACNVLDEREFSEKYAFYSPLIQHVYINYIRNCSLIPPPVLPPIPQWKLIRKKKVKELLEQQVKEPKFLQLKSPFFQSVEYSNNTTNNSSSNIHIDNSINRIINTSNRNLLVEQHNPIGKINKVESLLNSNITRLENNGGLEGAIDATIKNNNNGGLEEAIDATFKNNNGGFESDASNKLIKKINLDKNALAIEAWMDFDDFYKFFSMLLVYHKPKMYFKTASETKLFDIKSERESSTNNPNEELTSLVVNRISCSELSSPFLVIDSLKKTEIIICFQSLSRWFEHSCPAEVVQRKQSNFPGNLYVEPYCWRKVQKKQPVLKITTIDIKSVTLSLPPGRYVFQLIAYAQLGYNVTVCSMDSFSLCDERTLVQHLNKESAQFIEYSLSTIKQLKTVIQTFEDWPRSKALFLLGTESQLPQIHQEHFQVFNQSLLSVLKSYLNEAFTPKLAFALNVLKFKLYFHLQKIKLPNKSCKANVKNPCMVVDIGESSKSTEIDVDNNSEEINDNRIDEVESKTFQINNTKEVSMDSFAVKIQACFKGFYTRKLIKACKTGTKEFDFVVSDLNKLWNQIESNMELIAVKVTHEIFQSNPSILLLLPFQSNEWNNIIQNELNKVVYADYLVSYNEQPIHSAFVICREVFKVKEDVFILSRVFSNIPQCVLRIINNDNHKEMKSFYGKMFPQVLSVNELGYTFVVMVRKNDNLILPGKLTLRILGEKEPLPYPNKENFINSSLSTIDIKEYYMPNLYKRIFRYSLNVSAATLTSIQLITSNEDVFILFKIIDNNEEIYTCNGKGYIDIPSFMFFKDNLPCSNSNVTKSESSGSSKGVPFKEHLSKISVKPSINMRLNIDEGEVLKDQVHIYVIEAFVLSDSWPLTKAQWNFLEKLKSKEEFEDDDTVEVKDNSGKKSGKNKKTKDAKNKQRPDSQNKNLLDTSRPHWNLRLIVDLNMEQAIKLKKDTERESQIKAIKSAWELVDTGRSSRALISRGKYMQTLKLKSEIKNENEKGKESIEKGLSNLILTRVSDENELFSKAPEKKEDAYLKCFDVKPFVRSTSEKNKFDLKSLQDQQVENFKHFRENCENTLVKREYDHLVRNAEKERQVNDSTNLKLQVEMQRTDLIRAFEEYHRKFLPVVETETFGGEKLKKKTNTKTVKKK